jgi:hypothetical protein
MERIWNLRTNLAIAMLAHHCAFVFFAFVMSSPKRRWRVRLLKARDLSAFICVHLQLNVILGSSDNEIVA